MRRRLHAMGLRYRVDVPPMRGMRSRADIVFTRAKVAIFIHGCFWHSCPEHATLPRTNAEWWRTKLEANRDRDQRIQHELQAVGWTVLVAWEHEDPDLLAIRVKELVRGTPVQPE